MAKRLDQIGWNFFQGTHEYPEGFIKNLLLGQKSNFFFKLLFYQNSTENSGHLS